MATKTKLDRLKASGLPMGRSKAARAVPKPPIHQARAVTIKPKLAKWGDPYVLPDGKVVQPESLFQDPERTAVNVKASKDYRPLRKRAVVDLPASATAMRGIALVFTFTVLGVSDRDIATILNLTPAEVRAVRSHAGYGETFEIVASEFVSAKSQRIQSRIAAYADDALDNVHNIAMNGQKESNVLKASIDLLDRAGVKPKDAENQKAQQNELRITIVKSDSDAEVAINRMTIDG